MRKILVRFGELSTKGNNKIAFIKRLAKNIKLLIGAKPEVLYDRIFLTHNDHNLTNLKYVFGIYSFSPTWVVASDYAAIKQKLHQLITNNELFEPTPLRPKPTFKIEVKRAWKKFPHSSFSLNQSWGQFVVDQFGWPVDVKQPQVKIEIEIREEETHIFTTRIKGSGGYPTGINGKVLHLMSGGIDSPVAAYQMMKRGIHVDFLNFITPPHTDHKTVAKVTTLVTQLVKYQGEAKIYRINFTDLMNLIGLTSNQSYKINLMRRSFYRIANTWAISHKYLGLANGENVGQVASQTLESIATINSQASLPIYRPILTADKIDTIAQAKQLDLYNISIQKAQEACELFAPKKPVTKPANRFSAQLEAELVGLAKLEQAALATIKTQNITCNQSDKN